MLIIRGGEGVKKLGGWVGKNFSGEVWQNLVWWQKVLGSGVATFALRDRVAKKFVMGWQKSLGSGWKFF